MLAEIQAVESTYRMLAAIVDIQDILARNPLITLAIRDRLQQRMNALALAGTDNAIALRQWERCSRVGAGGRRFLDSLKATGNAVTTTAAALEKYGVRTPPTFLTPQVVYHWDGEKDFTEKSRITLAVEVTDKLTAADAFLVTFQYSTGWNGLHMSRVALAESPADKPEEKKEIAVDKHEGFTGARSRGNRYRFKLQYHDPNKRYWLIADVRGTRPQDQKPGHTG
jgi:hypothetical protein